MCCHTLSMLALIAACLADIQFGSNTGLALPAGHAPTQVLLVDLDHDGRLDALVPGRGPDKVARWCRATGSSPFYGAWNDLALEAQSDWVAVDSSSTPTELVVALRTLDGRAVRLRRSEGGSWVVEHVLQAAREPRSVELADLDGDGSRDIVVASYASALLEVNLRQTSGGFTLSDRRRTDDWYGGTGSIQQVTAHDVDMDGDADLLGLSLTTGSLLVWRNDRSSIAAWPVTYHLPKYDGRDPSMSSFVLADMDGDGDEDVVTQLLSLDFVQPVAVFWNDGGRFDRRELFAGPQGGYGWACDVGDLDADGDLDLVTSTALFDGGLWLLENLGTPGLPSFAAPRLLRMGTFFRHISLADTDGDCDLDLHAVDISGHTLVRLPNLTGCGLSGHAEHGIPQSPSPAAPAGARARLRLRLPASDAHAVAAGLAAWGASAGRWSAGGSLAAGTCGPGDGSAGRCDEPHPTPGCFTTACCEAVCLIWPDCCIAAWDQVCVDVADTECDGLYCPAPGSCGTPHDTGGCDDEACCARSVRLDGWCGSALWDQTCVSDAAWWCPFAPCELEGPPGARPEGEACFDRINDGCTLPEPAFDALACGERVAGRCTTGAPRDTDWYALPAGGHTIGLRAEFPASLTIVRGSCVTTLEQMAWQAIGPCEPLLTTVCVPAGESWYAIVSLGSPEGPIQSGQPCTDQDPENPPDPDDPPIIPGAFGTRYEVSLSCGTCTPSPDLNGDGVVNGADLGLLLSAWGSTGAGIVGDLNADGVVDGADLGALISAWG